MADVTDATFQTAVIERSATVPVVVDLWAEWCGPCKTLGPIIEKVIGETAGRVELAKVDVDSNPQIAQAFQAQSIPAVHALVDGKVVDSFIGAQPESEVRAFVNKLTSSPEEQEVARLVALGDEASLRSALEIDNDNEDAIVGLAEILVGRGDTDDATALLSRIPETAAVRRVAALARTGGAPEGGDAEVERQLGELLGKVKADDEARKSFVDLLEVLSDDGLRALWRKRLSGELF
ncbi:MAG: tetratricopeptide repeat protein [Actinomycetia bacterium]|nr:tetratricopeptide repeat protein [Actinomycetes bacterium]